MAAPFAQDICIHLETGPGEFAVVLPGGLYLTAQAGVELGDIPSIARGLLAQVNSALTPLGPFFTMFDVLIAVFDCVKAVKEAFGPPPQPQKLVQCIQNLQEAIDKLLSLHPALSIPKTVKSILKVVILFLRGVKLELQQMVNFVERILIAEARAAQTGNFELQVVATCALEQFDIELQNMNSSVRPLSRLIGIVNTLLELAGLPCIQIPLGNLSDATQEALDLIQAAIDFIQAIHDAIGLPDFGLGAIADPKDPC